MFRDPKAGRSITCLRNLREGKIVGANRAQSRVAADVTENLAE